MFSKSLPVFFILTLILISCVEQKKEEKLPSNQKKSKDSTSITPITSEETKKIVKVIDPKTEKLEVHAKIVAKYGEQWDFCSCVMKNDSINKALEKTLTDKQTEKLMARWEFVDTKCKDFLTTPNTTPEERSKHEWKVKQCLKNAK
jgi:hypothetical protein